MAVYESITGNISAYLFAKENTVEILKQQPE
jgi:hypothetical protein